MRSAHATERTGPGTVPGVADIEQCRAALDGLSERFVATGKKLPDRTVSCTITDLDTTFHAELGPTGLTGITTEPHPQAQVRLTVSSDDLLALVAGELHAAAAYGSGRLGIKASFGDLLLLRSLG